MNTEFSWGEFFKVLGIMMIAFVPIGGAAIYAVVNGDKLFLAPDKEDS